MSGPLLLKCTGQGGQPSTQPPSCGVTKPQNCILECQTPGTICAVCDLANAQSPQSTRLNDVRGPNLSEVKLQQAAKMLLQPPTWLGVTVRSISNGLMKKLQKAKLGLPFCMGAHVSRAGVGESVTRIETIRASEPLRSEVTAMRLAYAGRSASEWGAEDARQAQLRSWRLPAIGIICQTFGRDRAPLGNPAQRDGGHCSLDCPARGRHQ